MEKEFLSHEALEIGDRVLIHAAKAGTTEVAPFVIRFVGRTVLADPRRAIPSCIFHFESKAHALFGPDGQPHRIRPYVCALDDGRNGFLQGASYVFRCIDGDPSLIWRVASVRRIKHVLFEKNPQGWELPLSEMERLCERLRQATTSHPLVREAHHG